MTMTWVNRHKYCIPVQSAFCLGAFPNLCRVDTGRQNISMIWSQATGCIKRRMGHRHLVWLLSHCALSIMCWCTMRRPVKNFIIIWIFPQTVIMSFLSMFLAAMAFLCWCAVKQSINQLLTTCLSQIVYNMSHLFYFNFSWDQSPKHC